MFLVDTSVWVDYLRGREAEPVEKLQGILDAGQPFGITSAIYQEILQGADSEASFDRLATYFRTQVFYQPADPVSSYAAAARLYARCRRVGVTIRSTIDCLIAQVAIEHDLFLLHRDRDFDLMAEVIPELKLY
jgi:predicted nucleic acid-binding protein